MCVLDSYYVCVCFFFSSPFDGFARTVRSRASLYFTTQADVDVGLGLRAVLLLAGVAAPCVRHVCLRHDSFFSLSLSLASTNEGTGKGVQFEREGGRWGYIFKITYLGSYRHRKGFAGGEGEKSFPGQRKQLLLPYLCRSRAPNCILGFIWSWPCPSSLHPTAIHPSCHLCYCQFYFH